METCALHGYSKNLCGCASPTLSPEQKPDTHRDFTELAVGTRVRFAGKLREVEICPCCNLKAVRIEDAKPRRWPFKKEDAVIEQRALRVVYVHDATVGPAGFVMGASCVQFERKKKKK